MIDLECMTCKYCGGALIHFKDDIWRCQHCERFSMVSAAQTSITKENPSKTSESQTLFTLVICLNDASLKFHCKKVAVLRFTYHRRATRADPYPAFVTIETGLGTHTCFEKAPRFKFDEIRIQKGPTGLLITGFTKGKPEFNQSLKPKGGMEINGIHISSSLDSDLSS